MPRRSLCPCGLGTGADALAAFGDQQCSPVPCLGRGGECVVAKGTITFRRGRLAGDPRRRRRSAFVCHAHAGVSRPDVTLNQGKVRGHGKPEELEWSPWMGRRTGRGAGSGRAQGLKEWKPRRQLARDEGAWQSRATRVHALRWLHNERNPARGPNQVGKWTAYWRVRAGYERGAEGVKRLT